MKRLFIRKSIQDFERDVRERGGLRRTLGKWHLTALGVGATIGAGIFATTGTAMVGDEFRPGAGPAIVISFLLTAVTCGFAALCYAEFAAMVPISGSAYTYAYASLGELVDGPPRGITDVQVGYFLGWNRARSTIGPIALPERTRIVYSWPTFIDFVERL